LSSIGLYSITREASTPHDAATTTTGSASSIRAASSLAAKPPKTTEWTAPEPGAGEHRHHRLGDHRHVDQHPVPLGHAELPQGAGEAATRSVSRS
jgi:hypothetical protein